MPTFTVTAALDVVSKRTQPPLAPLPLEARDPLVNVEPDHVPNEVNARLNCAVKYTVCDIGDGPQNPETVVDPSTVSLPTMDTELVLAPVVCPRACAVLN